MTAPMPLALIGATASGKTEASIAIAGELGAEIVNIDAALLYRGMDLWTGKPTAEQRAAVPHHLLDLTDPEHAFGVATFQRLVAEALRGIERRGRPALMVGASGLYYRAAVDGLRFQATEPAVRSLLETEAGAVGPLALHARLASFDPEAASRIEPANVRRTVRALEVPAVTGRPFSSFAVDRDRFPVANVRVAGVRIQPAVLRARIRRRVEERFEGLLGETRALLAAGYGAFVGSGHLIGYAEAAAVLDGALSTEDAMTAIERRDRALARRQLAWFRRDPRVRWFEAGPEGALGQVGAIVRYLRAEPSDPDAPVRASAEDRS